MQINEGWTDTLFPDVNGGHGDAAETANVRTKVSSR